MLVDLRDEDLAKALATLPAGRAKSVRADVTQPDDVQRAVGETVTAWSKVDVLFSNAGTIGAIGPLEEYPLDAFEATIDVHVKGAFLACKYALPHMSAGGSIIITSSIVGVQAAPGPYGYVVAKHAQVGLMRALAKQVAPRGIRVNTIHPGPVDNAFQLEVERRLGDVLHTDATALLNTRIPLGRHARAEEIARSVLYLASDASSFTTGTTLMVDGGMST
jgi:NAD(P)-dependent dehydrogenase (short-subunit alcohol dehydrogenase family)